MKKLLLFVSTVWISTTVLFAQVDRPSQCSVFCPVQVDKELIHENEALQVSKAPYGQDTRPKQKTYWKVYSDRANNKTYVSPSPNAKQYSTLGFNDQLIIAQIKNGYALVIQDDKHEDWPKVSTKAVVRGWIPMSKLLLWESCPANQYGIYNKGIICINGNSQNIKTAKQNNLLGNLYLNPSESPTKKLKTDMKFYFIMKKEGGKALLSYQYTLGGGSYRQLYGWADESTYVPWSQRTCLEPNWTTGDAEYFAEKKITAKVYTDDAMTAANKVVDVKYKKSSVTAGEFDPFMYRMDPYLLRYPILDGKNAGSYYCTAFVNPETGQAPVQDIGLSGEMEKLNRILENRKKVNIAIVIDGTQSMKPYFSAVSQAINEGVKYFDGKIIKVGVMIFRDKEDGQYVSEFFPMTDPANPQLASFLESGGKYGVKSGGDKDLKEAVYYGINSALDRFNFKPEESNIMLVVGDCGDNGKMGVTAQTIIDKMINKHVCFMGFQVRNRSDEAFQDFNDQLLTIMQSSTQGRYDNDRKVLSSEDLKKSAGVKVRAKEVKGGYDMATATQNNLYIGMYRNADIDKTMPAEELVSLMENSFNMWNKSIVEMSDKISNITHDPVVFETYDGKVNEDIIANKAALINAIGADTYDVIKKTNSLVAIKGFTLKADKASNRAYYKPIIFISGEELKELVAKLQPVYNVARIRSTSRTEYVNAMKALVKSILPGINEQDINKKGYNEIMGLIEGLNESTNALKGPSIQDIADPKVVKQGEYMSLVNAMVKKYKGLQEILASDYKYKCEYADITYYWLPLENLP